MYCGLIFVPFVSGLKMSKLKMIHKKYILLHSLISSVSIELVE